jgi:hypothetical protein
MKITPSTIQISTGPQPKASAAAMGPTIGPAPAMELKWWPNTSGSGEGS